MLHKQLYYHLMYECIFMVKSTNTVRTHVSSALCLCVSNTSSFLECVPSKLLLCAYLHTDVDETPASLYVYLYINGIVLYVLFHN